MPLPEASHSVSNVGVNASVRSVSVEIGREHTIFTRLYCSSVEADLTD